ncbi:zinc-ribbon domain-containing protein [Paracoccus sp. Z118]|uniref:zinc-ribbon domain-containing protein n=1 Tax=Paracoccus sp. Z118 TaxID=2851017 RepID=UPI001C2C13F7|nr:zinc-ribbon domain-containing protein [Paracoccus sp. Z118]MBV0892036.1 zinc-ribbon domain-containing protein [Paracoccus sp. Z118]
MRLTCPRCGAQYEIDGSAIPAAGRAVECSACGHVWHHAPAAQGGGAARPAQAAARGGEPPASAPEPFVASERPQLHRRLDESVLSVLREEAAREIEARRRDVAPDAEQDDPDYSPPPLPAPGTDPATDAATDIVPPGGTPEEQLWPATTLTHAAPPASANILARRLEAELEAEPAEDGQSEETAREPARPLSPGPAGLPNPPPASAPPQVDEVGPPADTITAPADPFPTQRPPMIARVVSAHAPVPNAGPSAASPQTGPVSAQPQHTPKGRHSGYAAGFGLAVMAALILLALYALAPRVADQGELGARLMDYRAEADRGRAWLAGRADALVSGMRE